MKSVGTNQTSPACCLCTMQVHPVSPLHPATIDTCGSEIKKLMRVSTSVVETRNPIAPLSHLFHLCDLDHLAKVSICNADPRLQSVPALEQNSRQQTAHSRPHLWHNNCTPSNLRDSVSNGVHQQQPSPPEQCSHLLELPCICRNQAPSTCGLSQAADDLFTRPPSQGVENDSLGLDQRMIMSELAASRYMLPLWVSTSGDFMVTGIHFD